MSKKKMKDPRKTLSRKRGNIIAAVIITVILIIALLVGNVLCYNNYNVITSYLCGYGVSDDTQQAVEARSSGNALAATVEEEGAVLLKNDNNVLPLDPDNAKVNVFGWAGSDNGFIPQGTGSGTGSRNDYVTFLGGLEEAGIEYNKDLADAYNSINWARVGGGSYVIEASGEDQYRQYYGVMEADESFTSDLLSNANAYSDTAIIVLGRILGEGNDYSKYQYVYDSDINYERKLQAISENEEAMIQMVCNNFNKVILILNTTNPMELGFVETYDIDAALYIGTPGTRGAIGVANLLVGKSSPSGKLADTWAYDLSTAASYANSGREGVGSYLDISTDTSLNTRANKYSDYAEDIYIGYKWYETADAEGFWDSDTAKDLWDISNGYDDVVQYPFGYGMSYTSFKWTVADVSIKSGSQLAQDDEISITVDVENTGDVAGKDVVELYYSTPYTSGGIEKSAITLGTFAKTAELQPGEIEILTLTLPVEDMKSYDCYDMNNNGFMGYELEEGEYTISLRTDVHNLADIDDGAEFTYSVPKGGYIYDTDSVTGTEVTNQFTNYTNTTSHASSTIYEPAVDGAHSIDGADENAVSYMTRADFIGTFPYDSETTHTRNMGDSLKNDTFYVSKDPSKNTLYDDDDYPTFNSLDSTWVIDDLFGVDYDDPMWDELVSQLSLETCAQLVCKGGFGTIAIDSIAKPSTTDTDGPTGFNNSVVGQGDLKAVNYPSSTIIAQTWDWYMAYQVGNAIGIEGEALGIQGQYGPGGNLHRSPMSGRNFEYYSEDATLAGTMLAYEVRGGKEQGLTMYIKHIAANDSESGRNGAYKWLTEQNLRENYLRVFELAVKIGGSNAMMSSVDRVGSTRASSSYAMLTQVLRNEWGFRGTVITDYYQCAGSSSSHSGDTIHDVDECVRAGNTQLLYQDSNPGIGWFDDTESSTAQWCIFNSAKSILYAYADTLNYSETALGLEKGSTIGTSVEVFAWWVPLLVIVDIVVVFLLSLWIGLASRSYAKTKKQIKEMNNRRPPAAPPAGYGGNGVYGSIGGNPGANGQSRR